MMYTLTKNQESILKSITKGYIDQENTGGQYADQLVVAIDHMVNKSILGYDEHFAIEYFDYMMAIQAFREIDSEEDSDEEYTIYAETDGDDYDSDWQNYCFLRKYPVPKGTRVGIELHYADKIEFVIDQGINYA